MSLANRPVQTLNTNPNLIPFMFELRTAYA